MLTVWRIALILLCLFGGSTYSGGEQPVHPKVKAAETDNHSKAEQYGSKDSPISIQIVPTPEDQAKATNEETHKQQRSSEDRAMMGATILLAIVTTILALFTGMLWNATRELAEDAKKTATQQAMDMQRSLIIAQQSAGAAQMSAHAFTETAKALLAVQRPYIFVVDVIAVEPGYSDRHVTYSLINYGGVPAIVEYLCVGIQESTHSRPENPPLNVDQTHAMIKDPIILPQGKRDLLEYYPTGLSDERERFFQISVGYRGVFTQSHVTVATWRFDRFSESFVRFGHDKHNYTE
ncbi:MAG: hypothetical protein JSR29_01485 [Nitrospira sp.]|nr:hypothetical protein [Nitrospira sp.]